MSLEVEKTGIDGLAIIKPGREGRDQRGVVREFFRASEFAELPGARSAWQQINVTETVPGAVRGLHGEAMTKLVGVALGRALGVYVDARVASPTFRRVYMVTLSPGTKVLVPEGVCNGFQTTGSEPSVYVYAFDAEWQPGMQGNAVNPIDDALGFRWPIEIDPQDRSQISAKDAGLPTFSEVFGLAPLPPT